MVKHERSINEKFESYRHSVSIAHMRGILHIALSLVNARVGSLERTRAQVPYWSPRWQGRQLLFVHECDEIPEPLGGFSLGAALTRPARQGNGGDVSTKRRQWTLTRDDRQASTDLSTRDTNQEARRTCRAPEAAF